jgi:hypothetical protein
VKGDIGDRTRNERLTGQDRLTGQVMGNQEIEKGKTESGESGNLTVNSHPLQKTLEWAVVHSKILKLLEWNAAVDCKFFLGVDLECTPHFFGVDLRCTRKLLECTFECMIVYSKEVKKIGSGKVGVHSKISWSGQLPTPKRKIGMHTFPLQIGVHSVKSCRVDLSLTHKTWASI